jgi:hypothetical protein
MQNSLRNESARTHFSETAESEVKRSDSRIGC